MVLKPCKSLLKLYSPILMNYLRTFFKSNITYKQSSVALSITTSNDPFSNYDIFLTSKQKSFFNINTFHIFFILIFFLHDFYYMLGKINVCNIFKSIINHLLAQSLFYKYILELPEPKFKIAWFFCINEPIISFIF